MNETQRHFSILHILRAPVGGLFRHVLDVAEGQSERGHRVGIVADDSTGGRFADARLHAIAPKLMHGVTRISMARQIGIADLRTARQIAALVHAVDPDIVHGHGSKGGAYARLATRKHRSLKVYTPHGGSIHFHPLSPAGLVYTAIEMMLARWTDLFLFESAYAQSLFRERIGTASASIALARNGLLARDFEPVMPAANATDLLFVGELRTLKGIDLLLDALVELRARGMSLTATIIGDGPDRDKLKAQAVQANLQSNVRFLMPMPAREAFAHGRIAVVPSRAESLPYIVLELAAAGMPLIAADVGGIPEIFGPEAGRLVRPADRTALANAIEAAVKDPQTIQRAAGALRQHVQGTFSAKRMVESGLSAYSRAIEIKKFRASK